MTAATVTFVPDVTVRAWRHHDPAVSDVPGIDLGTDVVTADVLAEADRMVARGARRVALTGSAAPADSAAPVDSADSAGLTDVPDDVVDLAAPTSPAATVRALVLVRELTSHAVAVDWRVRPARDTDWRLLGHLYPPGEVIGVGPHGADVQREWAATFFLCRLVYRHGPGFVQVRDRRSGDLSCLTVDDPDYLAAIETLRAGAPVASVPEEILSDFVGEGLVGVVGDLAWWLPYRVRHWPWPVMPV